MILSVFGHMNKSSPEETHFWGCTFCAISASDFRDGGLIAAPVSSRFYHGKGRLSGGGLSRQASLWLDRVMRHGTGRVRVPHG
jgi:hypothetical protein